MTNTVVKTYRLPGALHKLILDEVEKNGVSEADFIRLLIRHHFERAQEISRLDVLEKRLINCVELESQKLASLIQQVIALAQPE